MKGSIPSSWRVPLDFLVEHFEARGDRVVVVVRSAQR